MKKEKQTPRERIKELIAKSGYKNLRKFHQAIVKLAGDDAITYSSLHNAASSTPKLVVTKPHIKTLFQIASVLKLQVSDLIKGTTAEPPDVGPSSGYNQLNSTSSVHNLYRGLPFKPQVLRVEGYGESKDDQKYFFDSKCFRFIYVLRGPIELILKHKDREEELIEFKKGDIFNFDASILHNFKNNHARYAEILITTFKEGIPWED